MNFYKASYKRNTDTNGEDALLSEASEPPLSKPKSSFRLSCKGTKTSHDVLSKVTLYDLDD